MKQWWQRLRRFRNPNPNPNPNPGSSSNSQFRSSCVPLTSPGCSYGDAPKGQMLSHSLTCLLTAWRSNLLAYVLAAAAAPLSKCRYVALLAPL